MLKAGSLLYAIFISLLITSIASAFVLFAFYQRLHVQQLDGRVRALSHLESAMAYLQTDEREESWTVQRQLFEEDEHSLLSMSSRPWGLFRLVCVKSHFKQDTFRKASLLGYPYALTEAATALYLADRNQPLSLAGEARLIGDAYLSIRGLKRAYIEGRSYSGKTTLEGIQRKSTPVLPLTDAVLEANLKKLLQPGIPYLADTIQYYSEAQDEGVFDIRRSAHRPILGIYAAEAVYSYSGILSGPILLKSDKEIIVGSDLQSDHLLLVAPKITIEAGFKGHIQAIASDTIIVGSNVELFYPSTLALLSENKQALLSLGSHSKLGGEMVLLGDPNKVRAGLLSIQEGARVSGNVFSAKAIELKGEVWGSVQTEKFYLKTRSSVYENHLMDGVIDRTKLPTAYVGSGLLPEWTENTKKIISWLP
jgi:hypothetical protein